MAVSVPELVGALHLPRHRAGRREWATSRVRYRVRSGMHIAHISDSLLDLLVLVDGRHTVAEIAAELEQRQDRPVSVPEVAYLLRERLAAAGIVRLRRGRLVSEATRLTAYAAPVVIREVEAPQTIALAAPAVVGATAPLPTEAPGSAVQPQEPATALLEEPPAVAAEALGAAVATPTSAPTAPAEPREPVPEPKDEDDEEGTLDLAELGVASPPTLAPEPPEPQPASGGHGPAKDGTSGTPPVRGGEEDVPSASAIELGDEEPTIVLPRERASQLDGDSAGLAALARGTTLPPAGARPTRSVPAAGVRTRRRGVARGVVLQAAGILILALLVVLALHGNLAGLLGARTALVRPTPTVAPTATPTPPQEHILPGETAYIVRPGDTLAGIATRAHISADALALVNADVLGSSNTLTPGTQLALPAIYKPGVPAAQQPRPLYYTLRSGDTLYQVGQLFGENWHTIADYNHITNQYNLAVGQGLIIPAQP